MDGLCTHCARAAHESCARAGVDFCVEVDPIDAGGVKAAALILAAASRACTDHADSMARYALLCRVLSDG